MRLSRSTCAVVLAAAVALLGTAVPAAAGHGPADPAPMLPHSVRAAEGTSTPLPGSVTAVVVKSWSNCSSNSLVWDALNANWSAYGSIPISIDYSDPTLCGASFTLADLEANGADVVILDDPAGNGKQFSADEVSAL